MTGTIPKGAIIYSQLTPVEQLKVGDIITFNPPGLLDRGHAPHHRRRGRSGRASGVPHQGRLQRGRRPVERRHAERAPAGALRVPGPAARATCSRRSACALGAPRAHRPSGRPHRPLAALVAVARRPAKRSRAGSRTTACRTTRGAGRERAAVSSCWRRSSCASRRSPAFAARTRPSAATLHDEQPEHGDGIRRRRSPTGCTSTPRAAIPTALDGLRTSAERHGVQPLIATGQDKGLVVDLGDYPDLNKTFDFTRVLTIKTPSAFPDRRRSRRSP